MNPFRLVIQSEQTEEDRLSWFNDPHTFEDQEVTRKRKREDDDNQILRGLRLFMECQEKARSIERLIVKRVLPTPYRKQVGKQSHMYVAEMDDILWNYFISNNPVQPTINSKYAHSYPDHGFWRREEFHRVGWINGNLPYLHNPHWFLTKWYEDGLVYKAYVYEVFLIRNGFSGMIRCEYQYYCWWFYLEENGWIAC